MNKRIFFVLYLLILALGSGCTYTKEFGSDVQEAKDLPTKTLFDEALTGKDINDEQAKKKSGWRFTPISDGSQCAPDMRPSSSEKYINCKPTN